MTKEQEEALKVLESFTYNLALKAGKKEEYARDLWNRLLKSQGVMMELAYFHDTGDFWNGYKVSGYQLTDILVWQVDHFKAYMDRHEDMNRYRTERLFIESIDIMLQMESNPEPFVRKIREESGTDFDQRSV